MKFGGRRFANPPNKQNTQHKTYWAETESRHTTIAQIATVVVALALIAAVIVCIYDAEKITNGIEKTAIYKGYLSAYEDRKYPIVEIDGEEYISSLRQDVRDASYVGHEVIILVDESNPRRFRVRWSSPSGIE